MEQAVNSSPKKISAGKKTRSISKEPGSLEGPIEYKSSAQTQSSSRARKDKTTSRRSNASVNKNNKDSVTAGTRTISGRVSHSGKELKSGQQPKEADKARHKRSATRKNGYEAAESHSKPVAIESGNKSREHEKQQRRRVPEKETSDSAKSVIVDKKRQHEDHLSSRQISQKRKDRHIEGMEHEGRSRPKRRRVQSDSTDEDDENELRLQESLPYAKIVSTTRKISVHTVQDKWSALPLDCIERASQLMEGLQRPAIIHVTEEKQKLQAQSAVETVIRRIIRKLTKGMPFPRASRIHREEAFDFERTINQNRSLSARLLPVVHANDLLESNLAKERALLEAEEADLRGLEANADAQASNIKSTMRKHHAILRREHYDFGEDRKEHSEHVAPCSKTITGTDVRISIDLHPCCMLMMFSSSRIKILLPLR